MKEQEEAANGKGADVTLTQGDDDKEMLEIMQARARGLRWGLGTLIQNRLLGQDGKLGVTKCKGETEGIIKDKYERSALCYSMGGDIQKIPGQALRLDVII